MSITSQLELTHTKTHFLAGLSNENRQKLVLDIAKGLEFSTDKILEANLLDQKNLSDADPKKDRLKLNKERISDLVFSLKQVADLQDPVGQVFLDKIMGNGLSIRKVTVPLGVVGIIYESRPNVTIDVSVLCLRSGNAVVLKGGKEAEHSNRALVSVIHKALIQNNLPIELVLLLPSDRSVVEELLKANRFVDVLIPRGSETLIQYVRQNSLVPTIETGAGVVHIYVHKTADLHKSLEIVVNAKTSRPSVCNALDCLLIDVSVCNKFLPPLGDLLKEFNVKIYADQKAHFALNNSGYPFLFEASAADFGKEWLDFALTVKVVDGMESALSHISRFSSRHSEAILAEDEEVCNRFLSEVDAAAVYSNASTRFTDGGEFGLGAEIGISTQKLHARGPFALEKLVTEKWIVKGDGQIRT